MTDIMIGGSLEGHYREARYESLMGDLEKLEKDIAKLHAGFDTLIKNAKKYKLQWVSIICLESALKDGRLFVRGGDGDFNKVNAITFTISKSMEIPIKIDYLLIGENGYGRDHLSGFEDLYIAQRTKDGK